MLASLNIMNYVSASKPTYLSIYPTQQCHVVPFTISCCSGHVSVQEPQLTSQLKPQSSRETETETVNGSVAASSCSSGYGIQVPRQRHISVSKSRLVEAIVDDMFVSEEEARQFISLSQCLDSILHAEHKSILEEMRADFDQSLSGESEQMTLNGSPALGRNSMADEKLGVVMDNAIDNGMPVASGFALYWRRLLNLGSSFRTGTKNSRNNTRVLIPLRFQRAFMQLLHNAEFEELSPRDLLLSSALNTDYLLTLPINVDWKRASESGVIVFRRGYASERQKGLLIAEKLDYLQSRLLQKFFFLFAKPLGKFGIWLNELLKSISNDEEMGVFVNKLSLWLKDFSLSVKSLSYNEELSNGIQGPDILSGDDPIWIAAQKAVTRYEGIFSAFGPRQRLLRKFLMWAGLVPSTPRDAYNLDSINSGSESNSSPNFLSRISLSDIWRPASPKYCENDLRKILGTAVSIFTSKSVLQEPAFQELILLYTEEIGRSETADKSEMSSLQMKIYEKIPIPDLPVVFPHKKLSFRIIDAVRLDVATILGLLAYFLSYRFENILSSPSAIILDALATGALVIYVSRVLLGYKQTRDRYQLLVNRTLYEKTIASGFGSVHFLLDASEQQLYKEAILVYAILLKTGGSQVTSIRALGDQCERFLSSSFQEKIEMPVDKALETLKRLGLVIEKVVDGRYVLQAMPCGKSSVSLQNRWNKLIS